MIIYNPENGAEIKDVYFENTLYFKEDSSFKPGTLINVGDKEGLFFVSLFEFLQIKDVDEAKKIIEQQKGTFKCEKCEFKTETKIALLGHNRKHEKDVSVDELGIPVLKGVTKEQRVENHWEEQDRKNGLIGEGLVVEQPRGGAIFR